MNKGLNNASLEALIARIDTLKGELVSFENADCLSLKLNGANDEKIWQTALDLRPWRKGPFKINELFIDSEWQSFIKFNALLGYFDAKNKRVCDIGCNNGYYMLRLLAQNPAKIIGFDPSKLFFSQFYFINHFLRTKIAYELLGVQDLPAYARAHGGFDLIFCLGVLYHRSDPISTLKQLKAGLNKGGELILDTLFIERDDELVLSPAKSYAKMSNVFFIPSLKALQGWADRAKFQSFEPLFFSVTDENEQRSTPWIYGQSLEQFLSENKAYTIEGYPPPKRIYIKLRG